MKKRLLGNALSAATQTVTSAILLFFLYRYLLEKLGPESLGIWSVVLASTAIGRLSDLGFSGTALKFVASALADGDTEKAHRLIETSTLSILGALCLLLGVALPMIDGILAWALPETSIAAAKGILPFALGSLLLSMLSGVMQSAIDAGHRMYQRQLLLIAGNVIYIGLTVLLTPAYGLLGVAIAQLLQSILLLIGNWALLKRMLPGLPLIPYRWSPSEFRQMLGYATNFQIAVIAGLLFDPVTKIMLAKFGGLSLTAYYDMANQLVMKARAVIVSAQGALVPEISAMKAEQVDGRERLFFEAYGFSYMVVVPYFICGALLLPCISWLWIGRLEADFVFFGTFICGGWFAASIGAVSYFYNLGTAQLIWNTANHVATGVINLALGWSLGSYFSGTGVAIAALLALLIPNLALNFKVLSQLNISWRETIPRDHLSYTLILLSAALILVVFAWHWRWYSLGPLQASFAGIGFMLVLPLAILADPKGRALLARIRRRYNSGQP